MDKLKNSLGVLDGKKAAIWGLAFKEETDDIRESPCIPIINALLDQGMVVHLHDPEAKDLFKELIPPKPGLVDYFESPEQAALGVDVILISTEWGMYSGVDLSELKDIVKNPLLIDGRNMLDPLYVTSSGFQYVGTGRPLAGEPNKQVKVV